MEIDFFSKSENICKKNSVNQTYKQRYNYKYDIQLASISTPKDKSQLYHKQTVGLITLKNVSIV